MSIFNRSIFSPFHYQQTQTQQQQLKMMALQYTNVCKERDDDACFKKWDDDTSPFARDINTILTTIRMFWLTMILLDHVIGSAYVYDVYPSTLFKLHLPFVTRISTLY